jgi:excisionase family DNA binding protein
MSDNPLLDHLCSQDTIAEILGCLDPIDTLIAYLRARGLSDARIAAELGITKQSVWARMDVARRRILDALPELGPSLDGRRHTARSAMAAAGHLLTVTDLAHHFDVSRVTILGWIRDGRLPGAYRDGNLWLVPASALAAFHPPSSHRRPDLANAPTRP